MENIIEFINQFFSSPQMVAVISSAVAYLTANLGTIILLACNLVKSKNKEIKAKLSSQETIEALTSEYQAKIEELCNHFDEKISKLDKHVVAKLDTQDAEKKALIEQQTVQLEEAVKEVKKSLSIDDVLEDK